jgi:hypothetical protein
MLDPSGVAHLLNNDLMSEYSTPNGVAHSSDLSLKINLHLATSFFDL